MPAPSAARTRYALVVACAEYDDARLQRLTSPLADAAALAAALADSSVGDFEVTTVTNESSGVVTEQIEAFFTDRRRSDLLLLYFSGHGIKDRDGRLYFAARNTRPDRLRSTGIPSSFLHDLMQSSRSRSQILILDCCHSGAFTKGMVAKSGAGVGLGESLGGQGRVILAASDAMQYAFESGDMVGVGAPATSVFTHVVVEGLRHGHADLDRDGYVTADELYDYAREQLRAGSASQTPVMWAFDVQGDLVVARTPGTTTPATGVGGDGGDSQARTEPPPFLRPPRRDEPDILPDEHVTRRWWTRARPVAALAALGVAVAALAGWWVVTGPGGGDDGEPGGSAVRVNFQSPGAPTPEGYLADFGEAYGARDGPNQGEGLTFGWVGEGDGEPLDLVAMGRDRDREGVDQRQDTLVHMEGWDPATRQTLAGAWELAVPDGRYAVTVSVGDASRNSVNTVRVEGVTAIDQFRGTAEEDYQESTVQVEVTDGRLTVDSVGGDNTKINYVEVVPL